MINGRAHKRSKYYEEYTKRGEKGGGIEIKDKCK
jgi:hypothetical protein